MSSNFSDAALILVGHGSTLNQESAEPTYRHVEALRQRGEFQQVIECFWKLEPTICAVLRGVTARRVFVVPLFISEGYFTEEIIPRELGFEPDKETPFNRVRQHGDQTIYYCGPVGTHPNMTKVINNRAKEVVNKHPFPRKPAESEMTLFIAGHGTSNNTNSRKNIEDQAKKLAKETDYADVHAVFMEESPRIESCYDMSTTQNIVMVPFFISDGLHSFEDIPVMLGVPEKIVQKRFRAGQVTWRNPTEKHGKRVWYSESIGNEPSIPDIILERVAEANLTNS